jgi:hypothetical protein
MRWTAAFALLVTLAAAWAGEVAVSAIVPWEDKDGCTPVLVRAESLTGTVELHVRATVDTASTVEVLRVEPGRARLFTLLLPSHSGWGGIKLSWSAAGSSGDIGCSTTIDYRSADVVALDPTESVPVPALSKLINERIPEAADLRGGYRRSAGPERIRRLAADALPERWQGWPAWLTLITTPQGDAQLSPAQREAIATWTRAGGALFTTTSAQHEAWRRAGARVGLYDPAAADPQALLTRLRTAAGEEGRPAASPVPGTETLPTAWFLTLAIAFAVLAGPVNLWWVRRRGRPHLLLITTPVLSAGTCILLIVVTLASDGIGRQRTATQVVVLDAAAQRCVGFSAVTFFCGIAPGRFPLDPEDRLVPMDESDFRGGYGKDRPQLGFERDDGMWADDGWIPARVNRQLAWTQARPERRRLTIRREGAGWRIGNGLGVAVVALTWVDPAGSIFHAGRIEAGADGIAQPAAAVMADSEPTPALRRLGTDARLALSGLGHEPGTFTCRIAAPLLAIPGPQSEDAEAPEAWVAGWLGPERPESP